MWSVAQVRPNQVHIASINLQRQGYGLFCPYYETKKLLRNKLTTVQMPLFIGYIFVELRPNQRWAPINSTSGVSKLLTRQVDGSEYLEPCVVPDAFINGLQSCSRRCDKGSWQLQPGTRVRILHGPFAGYEGAIASWSGADRCKLVLWMLNRDIVVEVTAGDIIAVDQN